MKTDLVTRKDYHEALKRFEEVFSAKFGTPESDEADMLAELIKKYEDQHFIIDTPSAVDAEKYRSENEK
jgi:HTH-type transcriptional regulator / antitoxin HigA